MSATPEIITVFEQQAIAKADDRASEANTAVTLAEDTEVDSHEMAEFAAGTVGNFKKAYNTIEAERKFIVGPINEGVKRVNARYKLATEPLQRAESILKGKLLAWDNEQERLRREEAARKQREIDEARKKADEEAARKKAEAEAAAAKAAESGDQKAMAEAEAAQEQAEDAEDHAEALEHTAPVVAAPAQKVAGVSKRKNWKVEITNVDELIKAVVEGTVPKSITHDDGVQAAMTKVLTKMAKAQEKHMNYPGVRAYNDAIIASR